MQSLENYNRNKLQLDGRLNTCRECEKIYKKQWYTDNKERLDKARKMWQEVNMEKHKEHVRNYYKRKRGKEI
ncbi:MAG: hypothetical protein MUF15_23870 [Acidobacteria bacterium]|nr:hypothetical protein [Acidobacteriota bacterium]